MKTRKHLMIAVCCVVAIAILSLWMSGTFEGSASDAAKHRAMGRISRTQATLGSMKKNLPAGLVSVLHLSKLEGWCSAKWESQREALVASGYFTNVVLAIPRADEPPDTPSYYQHQRAIIRKTADQIRAALRGHGSFRCWWPSNGVVVITCRPWDVPICAKTITE